MGAKRSLFLLESAANGMRRNRPTFQTGEKISRSGIYRVIHSEHRLPHEVTLLRNEEFPRCAQCADSVRFQLARKIKELELDSEVQGHICLYELPVLDDDEEKEIAV